MKWVRIKKYFHFHNVRSSSLWTSLNLPAPTSPYFRWWVACLLCSSFGLGGRALSPLSSCPLSCCLPQSPLQRSLHSPGTQPSSRPWLLSLLVIIYFSGTALTFMVCSSFSSPLVWRFYPSHHPSKITRKLDKRVCFSAHSGITQEKEHWRKQGDW